MSVLGEARAPNDRVGEQANVWERWVRHERSGTTFYATTGLVPWAPLCTGLQLRPRLPITEGGGLLRHAAGTMVTSVFTLLMLPPMFSETNRWSADIKHTLVSAAWNRLVEPWEPDPGSLAYTATVSGSWLVYTLWPLITVALAVLVVRRRDV